MATFFGEVLPVFSRAVADFDEDEDSSTYKECEVCWAEQVQEEIKSSASKCLECNTLVVATGPAATAFAETCLLGENAQLVANITEKDDSEGKKDHDRRGPSMHRLQTDPKIIVYKSQIDVFPEQSFSIVSEVLKHIPKSANVVILTTQAAVDYKGDCSAGKLLALKTTAFSQKLTCGFIKTPNIIAGLPAQVLTHCQIENRPAVLYVVYMENMYFDMSDIAAFRRVLEAPPLKGLVKDVMSKQEVEKKADLFAQSHNFFT